jgi:putative flippase GtrA
LFGYGLFVVLVRAGLHYSLAALLATIAGVLFNFKTTGWFVFRSRDNRRLLRFVGVYVAGYLLNIIGLRLLAVEFGLGPYTAGVLLLFPMAMVMFLLQRKLVYR